MSRFLSNNQELVVNFLNTHLAMVALLMPWKRVTIENKASKELTHILVTLFDMFEIGSDTNAWHISMSETDDTLHNKTISFIALAVFLLFLTIVGFAANVFYARDVTGRALNDIATVIVSGTLLFLVVFFQNDFNKHWKYESTKIDAAHTYDWEQHFLVIGILAGSITLSLVLITDKFSELKKSLFK